jgi:formamidopyrimidine-DNA glycosylase
VASGRPLRHTRPVPEVLEVELARRAVAPLLPGARVRRVATTDPIVVGPGVDELVAGVRLLGLGRIGKQLVLATERGPVGVHFGMTGRWLVDDVSTIGELAYSSRSSHERWDRWVLELAVGRRVTRRLRLHDPRRLARVVVAPPVQRLGPDALTLTRTELAAALARRAAPLKAVLLDQTAVAGLGNLLVDEVLWWAGLDPRRPGRSLDADEVRTLHAQVRRRLPVMMRRGGSHTGVLSPDVRGISGWPCPRDGTPMERSVVGGRTTIWCSLHQT